MELRSNRPARSSSALQRHRPEPGPLPGFLGSLHGPEARAGRARDAEGQAAAGHGPFKEERGRGPGEGRVRARISAARRRRPESRIWSARRRRGRRGRRGGASLGLGRSSLPAAASRLPPPPRAPSAPAGSGRHFRALTWDALTWDALTCLRALGHQNEGPAGAAEGRESRRPRDPAGGGGCGAGAERETGSLSLPKSRREGGRACAPRAPAASRAGPAPSPPH